MDGETLCVKQEDGEKISNLVKPDINGENTGEKLNDVISADRKGQTVRNTIAKEEPLVPDLSLFSYEVQQGYRIFRELSSDQYKSITYPFITPVDVEGLNLWDYHTRIETPMSFNQSKRSFIVLFYILFIDKYALCCFWDVLNLFI